MDHFDFKNSLTANEPPASLSIYLAALWQEGKGNWSEAHQLIQDLQDTKAAWIHAYLHRKEGDDWNADYWYRKAEKKRPSVSLAEEWEELVNHFLH